MIAETKSRPISIRLTGINKWYGDFQALRSVDLEVERGEIIVICGPSGSGKSTLIRCINQLERHDDGEIVVNGITVDGSEGSVQDVPDHIAEFYTSAGRLRALRPDLMEMLTPVVAVAGASSIDFRLVRSLVDCMVDCHMEAPWPTRPEPYQLCEATQLD